MKMKHTLALLTALLLVGCTTDDKAADSAKTESPKPDAPKVEKGKAHALKKPDSVSEADWAKFLAANNSVLQARGTTSRKSETGLKHKDEVEQRYAAILKADASLEPVIKALQAVRAANKAAK